MGSEGRFRVVLFRRVGGGTNMIIEVSKVSPDGSRYVEDIPVEALALENERQVKVESPVHCDFFAHIASKELIVKGTFSVRMSFQCGRCAEFFSTTLEDSDFLRAYEISEGVESVDLTPDVREDILVDLPAYPLCSAGCRGLCPQCGTNLNRGTCRCASSGGEGPSDAGGEWGKLDGLKL
jgi:uncharacterized protein